jgi:methyl-accepting chemotaxis protein
MEKILMEWFFKKVNTFNVIKVNVGILMVLVLSFNAMSLFFHENVSREYQIIFSIVSSIILCIVFLVSHFGLKRYTDRITYIGQISNNVSNGTLSDRITDIDKTEDIGVASWHINDMLDQLESFSREIDASLKANSSSDNTSPRRVQQKGLKGDFLSISQSINSTINKIALAQERDNFVKNELMKTLEEFENLDYRNELTTISTQEEVKELVKKINNLRISLIKMTKEAHKNALFLDDKSTVLNESMKDLVKGTEEERNNINNANSRLDNIAKNSKSTAEISIKMSKLANSTKTQAKDSQNLAQSTVTSMEEIKNATSSMDDSVEAIEQISFQTNILSLNAAVEAATAGEAGKGFAVVAGEVRNLASKSAEATEEIKKLVLQANEKSEMGRENSVKMIDNFKELYSTIENTTQMVDNVANASKEQMDEIESLNNEIEKINNTINLNSNIAIKTSQLGVELKDISTVIINDSKLRKL